jgi:VIT1/CCC1 family predicted Fe2+/Mn2+ transporter
MYNLYICIDKMVNRFEVRGMGRKDAELVVSKMAQYESFFVGLMITEELGTPEPEEDDWALFFDAFIMFLAFGLFGCIPLSVFFLGHINSLNDTQLLEYSVVISIVLLCVLGIVKSSYSSSNVFYAIVETLGIGLICSSVSYAFGSILVNSLD